MQNFKFETWKAALKTKIVRLQHIFQMLMADFKLTRLKICLFFPPTRLLGPTRLFGRLEYEEASTFFSFWKKIRPPRLFEPPRLIATEDNFVFRKSDENWRKLGFMSDFLKIIVVDLCSRIACKYPIRCNLRKPLVRKKARNDDKKMFLASIWRHFPIF